MTGRLKNVRKDVRRKGNGEIIIFKFGGNRLLGFVDDSVYNPEASRKNHLALVVGTVTDLDHSRVGVVDSRWWIGLRLADESCLKKIPPRAGQTLGGEEGKGTNKN